MAGYGACGFHCHKWEAGFAACYAAAGRAAPPTFVAPLGPDAGGARAGGVVARVRRARPTRCAPRWAAAGSSPGPTAWSPRRTSCGGCSPSRSCWPHPEWRGGWSTWPSPTQPAGAGRVSRLRGRRRRTRRSGSTTRGRRRRLDAHCARGRRRLRPLTRRPDPVGRVAGQPGPRRSEPGGQGGPAAQRPTACSCSRIRPGPGRNCARGGPRGQPLRRLGDGRRAARRPVDDGKERRAWPRRAAELSAIVLARTPADWLRDQLSAAPTRVSPRPEPAAPASATAPGAPSTGEIGPRPDLGRALGVDRGHPDRMDGRDSRCATPPRCSKAGRSPRSSPNTATAVGGVGMRSTRVPHHGPFVHVHGRLQLNRNSGPDRAGIPEACCWRCAKATAQPSASGAIRQ